MWVVYVWWFGLGFWFGVMPCCLLFWFGFCLRVSVLVWVYLFGLWWCWWVAGDFVWVLMFAFEFLLFALR